LDSSTVIRTNRDRLKDEVKNQQKIIDELREENSRLTMYLNEARQRGVLENEAHNMELTKLKIRLQRASEQEDSSVSDESNRRKVKNSKGGRIRAKVGLNWGV
jgi:sulfur relay (sulfurtransferase) complex TusBCD TusD component (DsrE family)